MGYVPTVREPTGIPSAPLFMVTGPPKSGKSTVAYALVNSPLIHQCWVIDLGEGSADEYKSIGPYKILEWGRSFADLTDTVKWAVNQPCPENQLNALILDSGTELWDGLKGRADQRARNSKKNREALARDPDYEVDVSMPYWNDAKEVWARVVSPMKLAGKLVGVVIVRSDIVAEVVNGAPTNRRVTSYQCEKTLPATVTAHVEVRDDHSAHLIEVRSLSLALPPSGLVLPSANPLAHVIELLSPTNEFQAPNAATPIDAIEPEDAKELLHMMNRIADVDVRTGLKKGFADKFGAPKDVLRNQLDEAKEWIADRVNRFNEVDPPANTENVDPPPPAELPADACPNCSSTVKLLRLDICAHSWHDDEPAQDAPVVEDAPAVEEPKLACTDPYCDGDGDKNDVWMAANEPPGDGWQGATVRSDCTHHGG